MTKEKKENRVKTGIPGFDKLIEGGLENGSLNLAVGDAGSGKTIFGLQYLIEGLKKGEKCLFVSFEEDKEDFYNNMSDFGWDLKKDEKENKFFFLEYNPKKVKTMIGEGGGEIERLVIKHKIDRLVIDSLTSFLLLFDDEVDRREAGLSLFSILNRWELTSLVTMQENPLENDAEFLDLEFEADSLILIYFLRVKGERERFIEILKMRGTKHSKKIHPLKLGKKGFKVSGKARSKKFKVSK